MMTISTQRYQRTEAKELVVLNVYVLFMNSFSEYLIGHFRITLDLFFKASPGAHPFI